MNDSEWPLPKEEFETPEYETYEQWHARASAEESARLQGTVDAMQQGHVSTSQEGRDAYMSQYPTNEQQPRLIIALGGKLRSGKDTVADHLVEEHGFLKLGMSDDSLHQFVLAQNPWVAVRRPFLKFWTRRVFERYAAVVEAEGYVEAKKHPDLRHLLQLTGTEAGRNVIGEHVWTDVIKRKALEARQPVVITGIRFQNEIEMVRELEGFPLWVERPEGESTGFGPPDRVIVPKKARKALRSAPVASQHASETSLSAAWFDSVLENDSTLPDLYQKTDQLVEELHELG